MSTFNKETSRLSYSSLTRLIKEGKDSFLNPVYKKSNALEKGTVIDKTVFKEEFTELILDILIPKPQPKSIIEYIIDNKKEFDLVCVEEASQAIDVKSKNYQKMFSIYLNTCDIFNNLSKLNNLKCQHL